MGRKTFISLLVILICLGLGLSMAATAQVPVKDPAKMWTRSPYPLYLKDTPAITEQMNIARALAGDDWYFLQTQRLACGDVDESNTVVQTPGSNTKYLPLPGGMNPNDWREVSAVPTKVFDNVYYVGGMEVGGWVIDTGKGYIMLDSGYDYSYDEFLIPNMKKLGLKPEKVKYILVTHAGPDHVGAAKAFQDAAAAAGREVKVIYNNDIPAVPAYLPYPPKVTKMSEGQPLTLGNTTITMVYTPRNVGGDGFSYLIPVKIKGKRHMWATFGNTGIPGSLAEKAVWRDSMKRFLTYVDNLGADIAMSSHPFVDGSIRRMELIRECNNPRTRNDLCGPHNPFLIGKEGARRYFEIMDQCAVVQTMRQNAGLPGNGLGCPDGYKLETATGKCLPLP